MRLIFTMTNQVFVSTSYWGWRCFESKLSCQFEPLEKEQQNLQEEDKTPFTNYWQVRKQDFQLHRHRYIMEKLQDWLLCKVYLIISSIVHLIATPRCIQKWFWIHGMVECTIPQPRELYVEGGPQRLDKFARQRKTKIQNQDSRKMTYSIISRNANLSRFLES